MSLNDPIADMLTRIRNASRAGHVTVKFPGSNLKKAILEIFKTEGFIDDFTETKSENKTDVEVKLRYYNKKPVIRQMERVSTPGRRNYIGASELRPVRNNIGISVVSTSKGVMTGRKAKKLNIGGEIICRVW
ncbi:MAG: 30S ribosomal protein S8 [Candidatus Aminicenantes bacterium]|nr:30S ribosomal protein S8 [Candidatus Aminicenantes bacterium]